MLLHVNSELYLFLWCFSAKQENDSVQPKAPDTLSQRSAVSGGSIRMRRTVGLFGAISIIVGIIIGKQATPVPFYHAFKNITLSPC